MNRRKSRPHRYPSASWMNWTLPRLSCQRVRLSSNDSKHCLDNCWGCLVSQSFLKDQQGWHRRTQLRSNFIFEKVRSQGLKSKQRRNCGMVCCSRDSKTEAIEISSISGVQGKKINRSSEDRKRILLLGWPYILHLVIPTIKDWHYWYKEDAMIMATDT